MSDEEKQIEIKKGYTPPEPPEKPIHEGYVPPKPPEKPRVEPPKESQKKAD